MKAKNIKTIPIVVLLVQVVLVLVPEVTVKLQ